MGNSLGMGKSRNGLQGLVIPHSATVAARAAFLSQVFHTLLACSFSVCEGEG